MAQASEGSSDNPGVIVRPPVLYLGALIAGIAVDVFWPVAALPFWLRFGVGPVLIVAAAVIMALATRRFAKAGTNIPTNLPTTALVTSGPHRYSRNPIYVALSLFYGGLALAAGSVAALVLLIPVLIVMRYGVIAREERYLEVKFGEEYRAYKARTRRWL